MANEATIQASLAVKSGSLDYRSNPTKFLADVADPSPPSPGRVIATLDGTDVDLSLMTQPGLCWVQNLDPTNFITIGVYDGGDPGFYPVLELLPGEFYPLRLSRSLLEQFSGTGTTPTTGETLRIKADYAPCEVRFDCFEA